MEGLIFGILRYFIECYCFLFSIWQYKIWNFFYIIMTLITSDNERLRTVQSVSV